MARPREQPSWAFALLARQENARKTLENLFHELLLLHSRGGQEPATSNKPLGLHRTPFVNTRVMPTATKEALCDLLLTQHDFPAVIASIVADYWPDPLVWDVFPCVPKDDVRRLGWVGYKESKILVSEDRRSLRVSIENRATVCTKFPVPSRHGTHYYEWIVQQCSGTLVFGFTALLPKPHDRPLHSLEVCGGDGHDADRCQPLCYRRTGVEPNKRARYRRHVFPSELFYAVSTTGQVGNETLTAAVPHRPRLPPANIINCRSPPILNKLCQRPGDRVGLRIDMDQRTIHVYRNGRLLFQAFDNIDTSKPLYPAVAVAAGERTPDATIIACNQFPVHPPPPPAMTAVLSIPTRNSDPPSGDDGVIVEF